jgi:hypothetical protein
MDTPSHDVPHVCVDGLHAMNVGQSAAVLHPHTPPTHKRWPIGMVVQSWQPEPQLVLDVPAWHVPP